MKKYRRFIQTSKYLDEDSNEVLFDDKIVIDVEVDVTSAILSSKANKQFNRFPGKEQFRQDVIHILEDKYEFEVIEDVYDGVKQKGHFSNRLDSFSLYFDTYYNLANASNAMQRLGIRSAELADTQVYCFIHFRFSDHNIPDEGDANHKQFLRENSAKYLKNRPQVTHVIDEESIEVTPADLALYYEEALDDLQYQLDMRIAYWVKKADRYRNRQ